jgi:hypothetical protein
MMPSIFPSPSVSMYFGSSVLLLTEYRKGQCLVKTQQRNDHILDNQKTTLPKDID